METISHDPTTATTRPCSKCKAAVPIDQKQKTCKQCREKSRAFNARTKERKQKEMELTIANITGLSTAMKRPLEEGGVGSESWNKVTKRLKKEFEDAKGKGKGKAKDITNVGSHTDGRIKKRVIPATATGATEYQSASLLYSALSYQNGSQNASRLSFKASYTIVATATPSISLTRRVELVGRELKKELKKIGAGFDRLKPTGQINTALTSTHTFACTCHHNESSASMTTSDSLKHMQSDLSRYFGGISSKSPSSAMASAPSSDKAKMEAQGCGGTVEIMVEDDFSHAMGIKGHKILVAIRHPAA